MTYIIFEVYELRTDFFHISCQERLANIGPEEFVQTFIPRDDADLRVRKRTFLDRNSERIRAEIKLTCHP